MINQYGVSNSYKMYKPLIFRHKRKYRYPKSVQIDEKEINISDLSVSEKRINMSDLVVGRFG
jgi:hypothetical protein